MEKGKIMNYHNISYPDQNNGDGLRVVLWLSGCNHKCFNCQNPQTWNPDSGVPFDDLAEEELFRELNKDYISGLTLTGGDPLHESNLDGVLNIINKINLLMPEKTIWLYTGYTWEQIFNDGLYVSNEHPGFKRQKIVGQCNVLVDGQYIDPQRDITLKWRGSSNQRVIDATQSIKKGEIVLWTN